MALIQIVTADWQLVKSKQLLGGHGTTELGGMHIVLFCFAFYTITAITDRGYYNDWGYEVAIFDNICCSILWYTLWPLRLISSNDLLAQKTGYSHNFALSFTSCLFPTYLEILLPCDWRSILNLQETCSCAVTFLWPLMKQSQYQLN